MKIQFTCFLTSNFSLLKEKVLTPQTQKILVIAAASLVLLGAAYLICRRCSFKAASNSKSEKKLEIDDELSGEDLNGNSPEFNEANLSNLTIKSLTYTTMICLEIFQSVLVLPIFFLQSLNLHWCKSISDAGLAHLASLASLQSLKLTSPILVLPTLQTLPLCNL